jgi:NADH:ubiquinone oxidoreductase subunit E
MLTIRICVGSSCYLKGSYKVIKALQELIEANKLDEIVDLNGSFCLGHCTDGVSVKFDEEEKVYSVNENNVEQFFENEILRRLQN